MSECLDVGNQMEKICTVTVGWSIDGIRHRLPDTGIQTLTRPRPQPDTDPPQTSPTAWHRPSPRLIHRISLWNHTHMSVNIASFPHKKHSPSPNPTSAHKGIFPPSPPSPTSRLQHRLDGLVSWSLFRPQPLFAPRGKNRRVGAYSEMCLFCLFNVSVF